MFMGLVFRMWFRDVEGGSVSLTRSIMFTRADLRALEGPPAVGQLGDV